MAFMKTNAVDITVNGTTYNSLSDFGLAIQNTDYIGEPIRHQNTTIVPGKNGLLDFTDVVFGGPTYQYRPIRIIFGGLEDSEDWDGVISDLRNLFEGKDVQLTFANDPDWYYSGRASIEKFNHNRALGVFEFRINTAYPYKQKDITLTTTATTEGASVTASVTEQTVIPQVACEENITIDAVGKNLLPYPFYQTTRTNNGITFTDNGDGTITANGTATANATFDLTASIANSTLYLASGLYTVSLGVSGGSSSTYLISVACGTEDKGSSTPVSTLIVEGDTVYSSEYTFDATGYPWVGRMYISVRSGYTCNNVVFKPMLRLASETDDTWEPYEMVETSFNAGTSKNPDLRLTAGTHTLTVKGSGAVTITYQDGSL